MSDLRSLEEAIEKGYAHQDRSPTSGCFILARDDGTTGCCPLGAAFLGAGNHAPPSMQMNAVIMGWAAKTFGLSEAWLDGFVQGVDNSLAAGNEEWEAGYKAGREANERWVKD